MFTGCLLKFYSVTEQGGSTWKELAIKITAPVHQYLDSYNQHTCVSYN